MYFDLIFSSQLVFLALGEVERPPHRRVDPFDARDAVPLVHEGEVEQDDVEELDLKQRHHEISRRPTRDFEISTDACTGCPMWS